MNRYRRQIISYFLTVMMIITTFFGNLNILSAQVMPDYLDENVVKEIVSDELLNLQVEVTTPESIKLEFPTKTETYEPEGFVFNGQVFLVGDSTVCNYDTNTVTTLNRQGWGMRLGDYLSQDVEITNLALSGRSSRSFVKETNYEVLVNSLSEGSYLFIQFGHNDEKVEDKERGTYPNLDLTALDEEGKDEVGRYSFEWFLLNKYIKLAQDKGAVPVLVTPIARRGSSGNSNISGHLEYTAGIKSIAEEYGIACIDLTAKTDELYTALYQKGGAEATAEYHAWKNADTKTIDNTHLSAKGAKEVSKLVIESIEELGLALADYIEMPAIEAPTNWLLVDGNIEESDVDARIFKTVREAVDFAEQHTPASEEDRITIEIMPGTYREQIVIKAPYITLTKKPNTDGDVVITWYYGIGYVYKSVGKDGFYNPDSSTWWTDEELGQADSSVQGGIKGKPDRWGTTVNITTSAKGFIAKDITFENSFNQYVTEEEILDGVKPETTKPERTASLTDTEVQSSKYRERAAAMHVRGDKAVFENCTFISKQDTLYIDGRVYFEECTVEGTTDFIFGGAAAVFNECIIRSNFGEGESGGYISAASTSPAQKYGYLFYNCVVTGNGKTTFGRPWGSLGGPQVTFYNTVVKEGTDHINGAAWNNMGNTSANEARFYEYGSIDGTTGKPLDTTGRIVNTVADMGTVINKWQVLDLNPYNYLKGSDDWDPMNVKSVYGTVQEKIATYSLESAENIEYDPVTGEYKVYGSFDIPKAPVGYEVHAVSKSDFVQVEGNKVTVISPAFGTSAKSAEMTIYMMDINQEGVGAQLDVKLVLLPTQSDNAGEAIKAVKAALDEKMMDMYGNEVGELVVTASMDLFTENDNFPGYTYTWESSNSNVISKTGTVNRPSFEDDDAQILLSCIITDGKETVEAIYSIKVPKMKYGTWETFEGATLGNESAGVVKWEPGSFDTGWEEHLTYGVVDAINYVTDSTHGKFYSFKQDAAVGGNKSANIRFNFNNTTQNNVTEFTVDFYAAPGSGKMELYFRASNNQVPIRPQFNNGLFKNINPSMGYESNKWYTLKMITDATDEVVSYDFYILDQEGNLVAKSENVSKIDSATTTDITYVQFRHDRKGTTPTEMYFDNFGFIDYNQAVAGDIEWIENYLLDNTTDLTSLPTEGPRGTAISYTYISGDQILGEDGALNKGTATIKATVARGYINGADSTGYKMDSEPQTVTVKQDQAGNVPEKPETPDNSQKTVSIHLAGDSTVKTYGANQFIGGWGEYLQDFIDTDKVTVKNYAQGGRSSRSFINEGRLIDTGKFTTSMAPVGMGPISDQIKEGDYLIIQFGHNDDASKGYSTMYDRMVPLGTPDENGIYPVTPGIKTTTKELPQSYIDALDADTKLTEEAREAAKTKALAAIAKYGDEYYSYDCGGTYKWYLKQYVDYARENGATPILVTPVARKYFSADGNIESKPGHHGGSDAYTDFTYVEAVRQLAKEEGVILIDLFDKTVEIYETLGEEDSNYLQSIRNEKKATIDGQWVSEYNTHMANGTYFDFDGTHQNKIGAYLFAAKLAEGLMEQENESLAPIKEAIYTIPTQYVEVPDLLLNRLSDLEQLYSLVKPIDPSLIEEEKPEIPEEKPEVPEEKPEVPEEKPEVPEEKPEVPEEEPEESEDDDDESTSKPNLPSTGNSSEEVKETEKEEIIATPVTFTDLENCLWAKDAIEKLANAQIINGIGDNKFAPHSTIKRADFILMITKILGLEGTAKDNFDDVDVNKYYANAIGLAKEMKLITGVGNHTFNPEGMITRQDVMCIVARVLDATGIELETEEIGLTQFKDANKISDYAKESIAALVNLGIVKGTGEVLEPTNMMTRAQASVLLAEVYEVVESQK